MKCFRNTTISSAPFRKFYGSGMDYYSKFQQSIHNGVIAKFHIGVRSDIVASIQRLVNEQTANQINNNFFITLPALLTRPGDVAHFWKIDPRAGGAGLRNRVTEAIVSLKKAHNGGPRNNSSRSELVALAGEVSARAKIGRNSVNDAYASALLHYKIIVVCQRDKWEDHYRLMEGMAGGALVMSDPKVYMPAGYPHGVNIIIYESIEDLQNQILYYLENDHERIQIAQAGYELAMKHHRPWHRMERFLLGRWPNSTHDPVIPLLQ